MYLEIGIDIYILICIKSITSKNLLYSTGNSTSLCCAVETNNILKQLYPNKKILKKEKKKIFKIVCPTDVENKCMDTKVGREDGVNWEIGIDIYALACIK